MLVFVSPPEILELRFHCVRPVLCTAFSQLAMRRQLSVNLFHNGVWLVGINTTIIELYQSQERNLAPGRRCPRKPSVARNDLLIGTR